MDRKDLKQWMYTATPEEIIEYWKKVLAPKYGYKQLIDIQTGKVIAKV